MQLLRVIKTETWTEDFLNIETALAVPALMNSFFQPSFSALTVLVGQQKGHVACTKTIKVFFWGPA